MKIYLEIKPMTFEEENNEIEHQLIFGAKEEDFYGYDEVIDLPENHWFVKKARKEVYRKNIITGKNEGIDYIQYITKEQDSWFNYPLYEFKNGEIIEFDYTGYEYFGNTDRRVMLGRKISKQYNISAELKILRKAIKGIAEQTGLKDSEKLKAFNKYDNRIEDITNKFPKNKINGQIS
jgi:hypothetical protein